MHRETSISTAQIKFFQQLLSKSKAPKTARIYTNLFFRWKQRAMDHNVSSLPTSPMHFAIYLSDLSRKGAHYSQLNKCWLPPSGLKEYCGMRMAAI